MGVLLITAILVVLVNLIADLAYAFADPKSWQGPERTVGRG
jgi:ABC-type dipeptide/oligopeptide/nickel transport system permease component